jgi:AmmeMemoRadiSam system protein B
MNLDFMPSPAEDRPGLLIRDPFQFTDAMLIIPPALVESLACFDGVQSDLDLRQALVRATGSFDVSTIQQNLVSTLREAGFLEDDSFAAMRDARRSAFAASPVREPAHAGSAYPDEPEALRDTLQRYMADTAATARFDGNLLGIAAPHVSPEGGWHSYRDAYAVLRPEHRERTCVILATSHYGEPERFGLTRKNFATPLGTARTDTRLVDWLAERSGDAADLEDYCFSFEHTAEFQVVFLQHALGPDVKILPILCGPFAESLYRGGLPEKNDRVRRFFDALGELHAREGSRLLWVLGVDMAHIGARYGDRFRAQAHRGFLEEVAARDRLRMESINAGDSGAFWDQVQPNHDDLKWCGSSPFYTFLKSVPGVRGESLRYEQWNIDEQSVVSFAGMAFSGPPNG